LRIAVGSDHRGFQLKQALVPVFAELGHQHVDMGCGAKEQVDYPDVAALVAAAVAGGQADRGVLICGTGIGMSITANKVPGIRAALCAEPISARMARQHNDANVLCLGGAILGEWLAREITAAYLTTEFEGGRHVQRLAKISVLEDGGGTRVPGEPS
jgi:ribose 5-phosphate isomerase B